MSSTAKYFFLYSFIVSQVFLLLTLEAVGPVLVSQEEIADLATTANSHTEQLLGLQMGLHARREGRGELGVEMPSAHQQGGGGTLPQGGVDVETRRALLLMNPRQRIENGVEASPDKEFQQN